MEIIEAKLKIAKEFISKYLEWLADYNDKEMTDLDYGRKYGWRRNHSIKTMKDTQKALIWFQSHIFSGRYLDGWTDAGIDRNTVYALHRNGFFSYDSYSSYKARMLGKCDFYYLSRTKGKEIYKAYKNGFFRE